MNQYQAKSGFKTFIITLSISLVAFGAIYYLITDFSSAVDIEEDTPLSAQETTNEENVFGKLSQQSMNVQGRAVLAGADDASDTTGDETEETTESTSPVPETGSNTVIGMLIGLTITSIGLLMLIFSPRKLAIKKFESEF